MKPLDPRVRPLLACARVPLSVLVAASVGSGLLTVAQAFVLGHLVVAVVSGDPSAVWGWWLVGLAMVRVLASYAADLAAARAAGRVATDLRTRILQVVPRLGAEGLSRQRAGSLTLLATRGVGATEPWFTRYLPHLVVSAVLPLLTTAVIFWLDWLSGLIVLITLPLMPLFAALIGLHTQDRADRQWRQLSALSGHFLDVVRGLPTLVAFRRAEAQGQRIREITDRYRRATLATLRLAFLSSGALELIATLSVALVAVSVGLRLANGHLPFSTALVVLLLAPEAYWPIRRVGAEFHAAAEGVAAFAAITELLDSAPVTSATSGTAGPVHSDGISVRGLTLAHGDHVVVRDLSVDFPAVGLTAVTGPSGAGKSTLLAALLGELAPRAGAIVVGGEPLGAGDRLAAWREQVAWAPQRPWLTPGTIAENILLGRPDASLAEVRAALDEVDLLALVDSLPCGVDTPLGEDGAGLSAGQRARVGLARVLVSRRPVVILDEPTAHLDATTEAVFLDTLRRLAVRHCVIVVAHRPEVIAAADRVVELPAREEVPSDGVPAPASVARPASAPEPDTGRRAPAWLGTVLGTLSSGSGVALTATSAWLITRASTQPPVLTLLVAIVAVRTFGLARPLFRYAERLASHDHALRLLADRRAAVYDALVPLVPGRLGIRRGDLLTSVVDDCDSLVDRLLRVRQPLLTAAALGVVVTALLPGWSRLVALAGLVAAGVAVAVARRGSARGEAALVAARAEVSEGVAEFVSSVRNLVLWQADRAALTRLDASSARLARAAVPTARAVAVARGLVSVSGAVGVVAMSSWAPPTSAPVLALLLLLPIAMVDAYLPAVDAGALSVRTAAAQERLAALERLEPAVTEPVVPVAPAGPTPDLAVADVTAGWGERAALEGVSFRFRSGWRLGVVGPSGCGKSTLAALLVRFIDPTAGTVVLDGADLRERSFADVRGSVGLVDDDPHVFASSVVENVRLARPAATDEEVEQALRRAHLGDWLAGLPGGLHTLVGEGSAQVSGGERARLGIARALLADPPVLVLDEPTAHLDAGTAARVTAEILDSVESRSLVWITHGTAGLDEMDAVLALPASGGGEATRVGHRRAPVVPVHD